jgi:hypothetical protein
MFRYHSPTYRAERAPTAIELWAKREAKSPTMAADLLTEIRPNVHRRQMLGASSSALATIVGIVLLASYFFR